MGEAKEEFLTDTAIKKGQRDHEGKKKKSRETQIAKAQK